MTHTLSAWAAVMTTALLCACSTPQPLLDQANHGASLAMSLQAELNHFREAQAQVAQQRLDSIRTQLTTMVTYQTDAEFDERIGKLAGTSAATKLFNELKTLADSRITDEKQLTEDLQAIDALLAKQWQPLPDITKALTNTQKTLAVMGNELPIKTRIQTVRSFAKQVQANVNANKNKMKQADAERTAPTVQPPANGF